MKLKTGTAFVIMIVLIIGSVLFGAYKGWTEEKAHGRQEIREYYQTGDIGWMESRSECRCKIIVGLFIGKIWNIFLVKMSRIEEKSYRKRPECVLMEVSSNR